MTSALDASCHREHPVTSALDASCHGEHPVTSALEASCEADLLASDLRESPTVAQLMQVFESLPAETPARGVRDAREKAWSAGAYSQGKLCGLRRNTKLFPNAVRMAVKLLRAHFPHATFATVAIYSNVCTPMHRDANNLEGSANYVLPLTSFANGGIWTRDANGQHIRATPAGSAKGRVLQVCDGPVEFDAHEYHCILPWEGSRVVLIGFTPNRVASLKDAEMKVLRDLGFPLPGQPTGIVCQPDAPCLDQPCKGGSQDLAETSKQPPTSVTFGVPFSESEFVRAAVDAGHPKSLVSALPEHIESCVEMLARVRRRWLDKWTTRAAEIAKAPDSSWDISDSYMRHVLCKKRLQLLDEIIAAEGYEDVNLARDMWAGFDLVGTSPVSNVLPGKVTPASLHPDDLCAAAPRANEALKASLGVFW